MNPAGPKRVSAYIGGFNLYFGMRDAGFRRFYWLNLQSLALNLLKPNQQLVHTKYFTARISGPSPGGSQTSDVRGQKSEALTSDL